MAKPTLFVSPGDRYGRGDVRWADASTQNRNRRKFRRRAVGHDMAVHR